ncbi:MAG: hypothetical protein KGN79_05790 [Acidobacteriota bacterium]|nr:hypothetical protein [Acidobacteriota bacterium]
MKDISNTAVQQDRNLPSRGRVLWLQRTFSFPTMLAGLLVVLTVLTVRSRFDDPDMWWHLKTGQIIWTTHTIPVTDVFSYTTNHHAFIPQEWLSQALIYAAYMWNGYSGLMLWLCILSSALVLATYFLCSLYARNAKTAFIGAMTVWLFGTIAFAVRPQLVGYLLLIIELVLIHLGRTRNPRWFLWLPALFALWINCHGSFFFGFLVVSLFLFSSFFSFKSGSLVSPAWAPHCRRMLLLALALSSVALLLNPDGLKQVLYPLNTILHQSIQLKNVEEWRPTAMTEPRGIALLAILLCSFLLVIVRKAELYFDELLLLMLGTWMAISHERMLIVFGILSAPILSRQLSALWEGYDAEKDRIWPNAALIGLSLLVVVLAFPNRKNLEGQVEEKSPVKAVQFIKSSHLSGPMLNDYGDGGYLIWALPEHPVFIDGRADIYEWSGVMGKFFRWETVGDNPNTLLDQYHVNFCLLHRWTPVVNALRLLPNWKQVYEGKRSVIFVRTSGAAPSK